MTVRIDTARASDKYRAAALDLHGRRLLITNFHGSEQEKDLTEPANCRGFGRIHHFKKGGQGNWPENPLPIVPVCRSLGLPITDGLRAQVFQNAVCNWRCWYCYVDFKLLAANRKHSDWLSARDLIDLYLGENEPPAMIDLSGGQPDLVPEWVPWMMEEVRSRSLQDRIYLWSDDNLSNDFFWRYLTPDQIRLVVEYPRYGRVCCFKGFDAESFSFNTAAEPSLFDLQFEIIRRLVGLEIDLYAYVTLTTPTTENLRGRMRRFVDELQRVDESLPLRTVPLEVQAFTPVRQRLDCTKSSAIEFQRYAVDAWREELQARFSESARSQLICDVHFQGAGGIRGPRFVDR
jgi:uncharacterized Fe-S cluster-containing radical SAM superfamily protein